MIKKIVIVSPLPIYGGSLVMFKLCKLLEEKKIDARIYLYDKLRSPRTTSLLKKAIYDIANITLNSLYNLKNQIRLLLERMHLISIAYQSIKCKYQLIPFFSKDTVVLYPDVIYGNPLHAKKVVRWLLSHNRFGNDPNAYGKEDLFFCFREFFNDYNLNPTCRTFVINYFDNELYKQMNFGPREGVCYIIRKGKSRVDLPKFFLGPIIDELSEKEKVAVLNRCKYCYFYDTQTFYTSIACVCGCIPIIMMEPGKKKTDYMGKGDYDYGKAFGDTPEEIEYAIKTRSERLKLLDYDKENEKNVNFFINEIEKYFKNNF